MLAILLEQCRLIFLRFLILTRLIFSSLSNKNKAQRESSQPKTPEISGSGANDTDFPWERSQEMLHIYNTESYANHSSSNIQKFHERNWVKRNFFAKLNNSNIVLSDKFLTNLEEIESQIWCLSSHWKTIQKYLNRIVF